MKTDTLTHLSYKKCPPNLKYTLVRANNIDLVDSEGRFIDTSAKVSFISPWNKIYIKFKPDCSLTTYEIRVTKYDAEYDIGIGNRAYLATNIPGNAEHSLSFDVTADCFDQGNTSYRIGLYAQSSLDHSWDVSYLLFANGGIQFIPADADGFEVLTDVDAPTE